ncbi:two-partner secretion domain-containing protein [Rodentibacter haemolyticus]|uniref:Hemagglutinin repeat-containing protein n=1 Tax=Rodentibacter haemolyticus TaxID=2778911 RepID=A0ABX6UUP6_9PAST|nr:hemagglutinin repeat-containing protein [Rodentibacter haemolyticus]QPB41634.1 hemagglutinin repeat-containing protein [Rodentibacter haemolyticus]
MNKQCFRVIFSKTLQRLVVVSELAKSEGKSTEQTSLGFPQIFAKIRPLTFSLFCALGFVAFSENVLAETLIIQADKSAPKNQQPIVLQTANGLPQVNIQTPNDKGLSHNKYNHFNVDTKGAILNNSRTNTQTQQGGWIQGNPYLARGEAKVILNEVTSNNPSQLKGYLEVAGKKADVIIANPNGIYCEGCGVINSDRTTFTTGKPQIQNGNLESFVVEKGKVKVSGKGLDNSRVDYTEILARETEANAGIWSKKETKVITGKNTIKRSSSTEDLQIIHTSQTLAEENQPKFAVDVGELGGMYSGKIHLIGTEKGVGVRNAGHIGASAETLKIDSQGRIVNTGTLNANKSVTLTASQDIENKGKIENKQGDIQLTTPANIQNDGTIVARGGNILKNAAQDITQQGETLARGEVIYQAKNVNASTGSLIAADVDVQDTAKGEARTLAKMSAQGKNIRIKASQKATLQGKNIASGKIDVAASEADLDHSRTLARSISVDASQGKIQANQAELIAEKDLKLNTPTLLETQESYLKAERITTTQPSLNTRKATWEQTGSSELKLEVRDKLQNQGGTFKNQGDITVKAKGMDSRQGRFIAKGKLHIDTAKEKVDSTSGVMFANQGIQIAAGELLNDEGLIQSNQNITINTQGQALSNQHTLTKEQDKGIVALGEINIQSADLSNQQGRIVSAGKQHLNTTAEINNQQGLIYTQEDLDLKTTNLTNNQGQIYAIKQAKLTLSGNLNQQSAVINADKVTLSAQNIKSTNKSQIVANSITLTVAHQLENLNSLIQADTDSLKISSQAVDNTKGEIGSLQNKVAIDTRQQNLANQDGVIYAGTDLNLNSGILNNNNGSIVAKNNLNATISHLYQQKGTVKAEQSLNVSASSEIVSTQHSQLAGQNINIMTAGQLDNQQAEIIAGNNAVIRSKQLDNTHAAIIAEQGNLDIDTHKQTFANRQGKVSAGANLTLQSGQLDNQAGLIQSRQDMLINTHQGNLNNQETKGQSQFTDQAQNKGLISLGKLVVNTQQLLNQQGYVLSQDHQTILAQAIQNDSAVLSSLSSQKVAVAQDISNKQGRISAESATITAQSIDSTSGLLQGNSSLNIQLLGDLNNQEGRIKANDKVEIQANRLNNQKGNVNAITGHLLLSTVEKLNNTFGYLTAKQSINILANGINNYQGTVYNEQSLLHLNLKHQALENQQGKVIGKENLLIESGVITNHNGAIYAEKQGSLQVIGAIDNQQNGKIHGLGEISIQANHVDNRGGEVRTTDQLTLNVTTGINNQKVGTTGSFIESGNVLNINTNTLDNSNTKATSEKMSQGILAAKLNISAQSIDNRQGQLHSHEQSHFAVQKNLDNRQGKVTGSGAVSIEGEKLQIDNQKGRLQAKDSLSIVADEVTTNGHIEANTVRIQQQQDFITGNAINANSHLAITTKGNLINQHHLYADESVVLKANHITNNVDSRISSANTQITAQGNLINEGLINSVSPTDNAQTVVKAGGLLLNTGKGRIYGDNIALQADRIENRDKDYGNGEIKSAVVASRGRLDIAAREIDNNTAHYLSDHQVGATLFSIGEMTFGRILNAENRAEGNAEVLRNNSSVLESEGHIHLNINRIHNNNTHFVVEHVKTGNPNNDITLIKDKTKSINAHYIIPKGDGKLPSKFINTSDKEKGELSNSPYIPMKFLRWAGFSRAGQLVYESDGTKPTELKAGDKITPDMVLATRNQMDCREYTEGKTSCSYAPAGQYGPDSPIWAHFNATAPAEAAPAFPFDKLEAQPWYREEDWFSFDSSTEENDTFIPPKDPGGPPVKPVKRFFESEAKYQKRLAEYEAQLAAYPLAKEKWEFYQQNIAPYTLWEEKYKKDIEKVDKGILEHNQARMNKLGLPYYRNFWDIKFTHHREDESKVLKTVPGQILAGGTLYSNSHDFKNERSTVISGQEMRLASNVSNKSEEGLHRVTDTGTSQYTYSRWRGGFKRYHQRKWDGVNDYTRIIETPFDMDVVRLEENVSYQDNKRTDDNIKARTAHQLSLTGVEQHHSNTLFGINAQPLGQLEKKDNALFTALNGDNRQVNPHEASTRKLERISLANNIEVRSIQPNLAVPQNVLYRVNPDPSSKVLIETDPDFTNRKRWLSSDYMFNALRYEPNQMQKRLGDGFYEQRLVREQINRLTGRNFVGNYRDFDSQYRGLMDAGVTFAQKFNLRPGIALSPSQVAQLTTDIVWFEPQSVRLPNGTVAQVLAPKIYALAKKGDITGNGTLLSANKITHTGGEFINSGTVSGRELVKFDSEAIRNTGTLSGGAIVGNVSGDVENIGGTIEADRAILLDVAGNFTHRSTLHTTNVNEKGYRRRDTRIGRKGLLHVKGENGVLQIGANNIDISGADVMNDGKGQTYLSAKNQLNLTALSVGFDEKMGGGNHYRNEKVDDVVVSRVSGKGDVTLQANTIFSEGAELGSKTRLTALAENDLVLGTALRSREFEEYHKYKKRNILGSSSLEQMQTQETATHKGSVLAGNDVYLASRKGNIHLTAAEVVALNDISAFAAKDILLDAAVNTETNSSQEIRKKSGLSASASRGIASVGYAKNKSDMRDKNAATSVATTALNAASGNLIVSAGNGDVISQAARLNAGKDIIVDGNNVQFNAMTEHQNNQFSHQVKSAGFGVSAVYNPLQVAKDNFGEQANQGSAVGIIGKILTAAEAMGKTTNQMASPGSPYLKAQKSTLNKNSEAHTAVVGQVNAGGNLTIEAREGSIRTQGTQLSAKGDGSLWAKKDIVLDVARSTTTQNNRSSRKGVSFDSSKGATSAAGVFSEKELGAGDTVTEQASVLSFGGNSKLTVQQGDVRLKGTQLVSEGDNRISAGGNVLLSTAEKRTGHSTSSEKHRIGEAVVSETERFSGYHRQLGSENAESVSHSGAMVASLKGNVEINAGKDFNQKSGQILAKKRIDIEAENVTFDVAHNTGESASHQSDLKMGTFARVASPIIDLIQAVESAVGNKEANDRVKAAQALGVAAKAYSTYANAAAGGALLRVEAGTGYSHSRERVESKQAEAQGNQLNAQHIHIQSRRGDIQAKQTDFTSRDAEGKRLADSSIHLNAAKNLVLESGQSTATQKGRQQSSGVEVGAGAAIGAQTGVYVYVQGGFTNAKQDERHLIQNNSHLDSESIRLKSGGNTTLSGAVAKGKAIHTEVGGTLKIESRQDEHHSKSSSAGAGGRIQVALGTAWGGSGYGNASSGNSSSKQVVEQSGLFAEEGGYHINANHVALKGGAIASTNPNNSELRTNSLTFSDIKNESQSRAVSGSISASANLNKLGGVEAKTDEEAKQQAKIAKLTGTPQSNGINPTIPLYASESDSSVTKATLTEGKIILNKDSQPTETTAKALGINTELSQANEQTKNTFDVKQKLKEQQVIGNTIGEIGAAAQAYTENKAKALNEEAEELTKAGKLAEATQKKQEAEKWQTSGEHKRKVEAVTTALSLALAGKPTEAIAVGAASPYVNQAIKTLTEQSETANIAAHVLWGAIEAELSGGKASTGAISAGVAELGARILTQGIYQKEPSELNLEEKEQVLELSKALAGVAAAATTKGNTAETLNAVSIGSTIAKNAVENNFLSDASRKRLDQLRDKALTQGIDSLSEKEKREFIHLTQSDQMSDGLLDVVKKGGKLSEFDRQALKNYINRYVTETMTGNTARGVKLARTMTKDNATEQFEKHYLKGNYQKDYSYPYAGTNLMKEQYVSNLSAEYRNVLGWRNENKSRLEDLYYSVSKDLNVVDVHNNSFHGKLSQSVMDGLTLAGGVGVASASVLSKAPIIGKTLANAAEKYPLTSDIAVTAVANTGYQLSKNDKYDPYNLLQAELSTVLTRGRPLAQQVSINTGISTLGTTDPNDYGWNVAGAVSGTSASAIMSKALSKMNLGKYNIIISPLLSGYSNEYFGDKENLKGKINKFNEVKYDFIKDK